MLGRVLTETFLLIANEPLRNSRNKVEAANEMTGSEHKRKTFLSETLALSPLQAHLLWVIWFDICCRSKNEKNI